MKKLLSLLLLVIPLFGSAQDYRVVSIPMGYHYSFNDGYADGTGTCTSCWTYANRTPGLLFTQSLESLTEQHTTNTKELQVSFYEYRTKSVNSGFTQENYCGLAKYKDQDAFTNMQVDYCQARVSREDVVLTPGAVVILGNALSRDLSDPDHQGALSAMKVWMLPNVTQYEQSLGFCETLFPVQGTGVEGGHWEYLLDEETSWSTLDGPYANHYPLDITLETLDQNTSANLRAAEFIKLRFVLNAEGGGEYGGFHTSTTQSTTEVPGTGTAILGPYNFTVYRCSPDLAGPVVPKDIFCNGELSGSFRLDFARSLNATYDEKMLLMLYKQMGEEFVFMESKTLFSADLPEQSYSWSRTLGVGIYKVRWMTKEGGDDPESIPDAYKESTPFVIAEPASLQLAAEGSDVLCKGEAGGSVSLTAAGGVLPYEFSLDGTNWTTDPVMNNLLAGSYTIMVRDANNCETATTITLNEPTSNIEATLMKASDPTAFGKSDGSINVLVSGGSPPYTYVWEKEGKSFSTEEDLKDIAGGTYTFQATDSNGCTTALQPFTLTEPEPLGLLFIAETDSLACAEETTRLRIQGTGSASEWDNSYTYLWADGGTDPSIIQAGSGVYQATVFDKYGNSFTGRYEIYAPIPLGVSASKSDVRCKGTATGSIALEISGGTPPYNVTWVQLEDPGFEAGGTVLHELPAGTYIYEVVDANGCSLANAVAPIRVEEPAREITVEDVIEKPITAFGASDGAIEVIVSGGTPPYQYEWIGPDGFTANTSAITGLNEGVYTLMVVDENAGDELLPGCVLIEEFELIAPAPLTAAVIEIGSIGCHASSDAVLQASGAGGVLPYRYRWFKIDQDGEEVAVGTGELLEQADAGSYVLQVTDHYGNTSRSQVTEVIAPPVLEITAFDVMDVTCSGMDNGAVTLEIAGGVPPYEVLWSHGQAGSEVSDLGPGTYEAIITDKKGCRMYQEFTIGVNSDLYAQVVVLHEPTGVDRNDGEVRVEISGGTPPFEVFANGSLVYEGTEPEYVIVSQQPGTYHYEIRDSSGCSVVHELSLAPEKLVHVEVIAPSCPGSCDGAVNLSVSQVLGPVTMLWPDGNRANSRTDLCAGTYALNVLLDGQTVETHTVVIPEPELPDPKIPETVYLCSGAHTVLRVPDVMPGVIYEWWQGDQYIAEDAAVTLYNEGKYALRVIKDSCILEYPFEVVFTGEVQIPEFVMATDVLTGEEVLAIDVTMPVPEEVAWDLPEEAIITGRTADGISFYFEDPGEYEIGMRVTNGECSSTVVKTLRVIDPEPGTNTDLGISGIWTSVPKIYPNPVASYFNLEVELQEAGSLSVKVYSLANNQMISQVADMGKRSYQKQIEVSGAPPGMYAVLIETDLGSRVYKVVKS
ncbi:T9SS type A sorting domain-containing protein [Robertkochia sediminum]|uniref:T9SS type A sorting domain-containing protein n=1 Tax=Robertkochia sediminum TaxID=2785326 RepID=UPI0019347C0B|nr:T9SS type A sorting domain-containing protein [Robertkochia sediminum]MBL7472085.1 T9SS type A sorting domain-containing protein [Robertkochia sediminum]